MGTKRFALRSEKTKKLTVKDDVGNVGAGRAAKGATLGKAKENASIFRRLRFFMPFFIKLLQNSLDCVKLCS